MSLKQVLEITRIETKAFFKQYKFQKLTAAQFPTEKIDSAWKGSIKCEGEDIPIIAAIPHEFPDELPKIYLTDHFNHYPIPHVDDHKFVCTYDTDAVDYFSENVAGILADTIEKARLVISDGISGRNLKDFETEFLAYWGLGAKPASIYSILIPEDITSEIQLAILTNNINKINYVVGESQNKIKEYVKNLNPELKIHNFEKALFLKLPTVPLPPFPTNNNELLEFLQRIDASLKKSVLNFLLANDYRGTVFFSVILGKSFILAGWDHIAPDQKKLIKGYRPGRVNINTLRQRLSLQKIKRLKVERIDSDRLQKRIGNEYDELLKKKRVCVIGCGSIGAQLAFYLAKSGIEKICLIDDDQLKPENIARHICGMSEVNLDKVEAVSKKIKSHFPNIEVKIHIKKFHSIFLEDQQIIYDSDLIISATGNTALERRLNQIQGDSLSCPPILYSWIEPYGIASHAVVIVKGNGGCFECCLEQTDLKYKFSVAKFEKMESTIREAGCQTRFSPYSALDADQASSLAARLALAYFIGQVSQSTGYTWLGDLSMVGQIVIRLNPYYLEKKSFSIHKIEIKKQNNCRYCARN